MRVRRWITLLAVLSLASCDGAVSRSTDPPLATDGEPTAPPSPAPPPGSILVVREDLGVLPGGSESEANAINGSRQITGTSGSDGASQRAFLWTPPGPMVDLGGLPSGGTSRGADLNDAGQVAGWGTGVFYDAFRWTPPGPLEVLAGPGADQWGYGINGDGVVAGAAEDPAMMPFVWVGATAIPLGSLGGTGWAADINDAGAAVGASHLPGGDLRGFHWTQTGGMTALDPWVGEDESRASALNESGAIVGSSETNGGPERAVLWASPGASPQLLGTLGGSSSRARDINESGVIVGWSETAGGDTRGFRRPPAAAMGALGTLGGDESGAEGVSDEGHVVGWAELPDGTRHAVAWWHYRVDDFSPCVCQYPGPPVDPTVTPSLTVILRTARRLDATEVDPGTLTLGDGEGEDTPVARRDGEPVATLVDVDRDGDLDLLVSFWTRSLMASGDLDGDTRALFLLGALKDRSAPVYGDVAVRLARRYRRR